MDVDRICKPTFMQWFCGETVLLRDYEKADLNLSYWKTKAHDLDGIRSKLENANKSLDAMLEGSIAARSELTKDVERLKSELSVASARIVSLTRVIDDMRKRSPEVESRTRSRIDSIREILGCIESDFYDHWDFRNVEAAQCSDGN